jgi:hypothetical protein
MSHKALYLLQALINMASIQMHRKLTGQQCAYAVIFSQQGWMADVGIDGTRIFRINR